MPFGGYSAAGGGSNFGPGDSEIGVKYRFVGETADRPQIGCFPMVELATGNAARGLGNGRTWYRLPLWIQKGWDPWTSYGGAGIDINHAQGMHNAAVGGYFNFSSAVSLLYSAGGSIAGERHTVAYLGLYWTWASGKTLAP